MNILFIWYYTLTMRGVLEFASVINASVFHFNDQYKSQKIKSKKECHLSERNHV